MNNSNYVMVASNETGEQMQYYSPQDEMMAVAELYAFEDNLRAGLTMQTLRNTTLLAQAAIGPMNRYPDFKGVFHDTVSEYAKNSVRVINRR